MELARLALAVRAGGELLGSIWIIDPGEDKREAALEALDRMAPLAGLHMLHARSASDFGERRNGDLIRTLMDDPAHASFAAAQLGLDADQGTRGRGFFDRPPRNREPGFGAGNSSAAAPGHDGLQHAVQHQPQRSDRLGRLCPAALRGTSPRAVHRRVVQEIGAYAHTISSHPLIAAVGGIAPRIEDLPGSRSEALQTLAISAPPGAGIPGRPVGRPPAAGARSRTTGSR